MWNLKKNDANEFIYKTEIDSHRKETYGDQSEPRIIHFVFFMMIYFLLFISCKQSHLSSYLAETPYGFNIYLKTVENHNSKTDF